MRRIEGGRKMVEGETGGIRMEGRGGSGVQIRKWEEGRMVEERG